MANSIVPAQSPLEGYSGSNNVDTDTSFNDLYHEKFDLQSNVVSDMLGGTVAAVADFGTSVWNSLPGTDYVGTEEILSKVSDNALRVYDEHPDAVHAASFIGGMFVPTTLALKGMQALRAGSRGASWFSNAGRTESLAKIDKLFLEGSAATSEYRAARNAFYARGAVNQITDAAAMEVALLASMHAHPLLEDYMADPVKNFSISLAFGGVIGGTVGHIVDRFAIGKLEHVAEMGVVHELQKGSIPVFQGEQRADQLVAHQVNIETLEKIIQTKKLVPNPAEGLLLETADRFILSTKAAQQQAFEGMVSPAMLESIKGNKDARDAMLKTFIDNGFTGANEVSYYATKLDTSGNVLKISPGETHLSSDLVFGSKTKKFTDAITGEETTKVSAIDVVFSPEFGKWMPLDKARHYGRARDLNLTVDRLVAEAGNFNLPNTNIAEETLSVSAAKMDAHYIGTLAAVDRMSIKQVKEIVLSTDDLPLRNAILARVGKDPDAFTNHSWRVTDNKPNFDTFNQQIITSQASSGVKATHLADNLALTTHDIMKNNYDLLHKLDRSSEEWALMKKWIGGSKGGLADAMESMRLGRDVGAQTPRIGNTIYNSKASVALRAVFQKNADASGYVYLYRGLSKGKAVGHGQLDSYTTDATKAMEFTGSGANKDMSRVKLYKVHVDDIIGGILDFPPTSGGVWKNEIIVRAGTLETHASPATIPVASAAQMTTVTNKMGIKAAQVDALELSNQLIQGKDSTISAMLAQGLPLETIAIRTNTPLQTVQLFSQMPEGASIVDVLNAVGHSEYNSASRIDQYMDASKRSLRVRSDANKRSYATASAELDGNTKFNIGNQLTHDILTSSQSVFARTLGAYYFSYQNVPLLAMLRAKTGEFVNGGSGNRFLTSADHFVRNMGDVGMIVSTMGKDIVKKTNEAIGTILRPINIHNNAIAKDAVALAEYNTAINVNASIKGWRSFDNGQFWVKKAVIGADGKASTVLEPVLYEGREYIVRSDSVVKIFNEHQKAGRELYELKNSINSILGKPVMSDIGLWIPAFNAKNKFTAYVWNSLDDTSRTLWGNTPEELMSAKKAFEATIDPAKLGKDIHVVLKKDGELWNTLNARMDPMTHEIANITMQHGGSSASAVVKANTDIMGEIAGGYEHYIGSHMRQIAELSMPDIMDNLTRMSQYNTRIADSQTLSPVAKMLYAPKDTANIIKNTILGNTNLNEYSSWRQVNQSFETALSATMTKVAQVWNEAVRPLLPSNVFGRRAAIDESVLAKMDYEVLAKKMEDIGAVNPWKVFDDQAAKNFGLAKLTDSKDTSKRVIYASNALAATVALRVGELAQPLVNAMSLPILTSLAIADRMPASFMGISKGTAKVGGVQVMYEGARAMNDPRFDSLRKLWKELGYFEPHISEANETLKLSRQFDRGLLTNVEKALDSSLVKILSKPADWSETLVRSQTMHTGAVLAKRLYPELDDKGVTIFARHFMDRAVGNYHSAQRPVFFQGTMGVALGLFQTYMLTLGQSIYRHLEMGNYVALGKGMLMQQTIFGTASMPGFNQISETIGDQFSNNNVDLTTGTYRALGNNKVSDAILYGLPSSMGPAFYTRGEIAPRVPNPIGGLQNMVGVNFVMQTADMVTHVAQSLKAENPDMARTLGEALSMQSMSRPLARMSELATGYSITRKGNTIAAPEDVWTPVGIMSRALSTRPLEEAKVRQAMHLNTMYGAADHHARQDVQIRMKTAIRGGNLTEELKSELMLKYMNKGGTPTGWNSAVNTAIAQSDMNGKDALAHRLRPDNAINFMVDNL